MNPIYEVYGIYDASDPDTCRYVGLTTRGAKARLKGHWDESRRQRVDLPIVRWMRKREKSDIEIRVLQTASTLEGLKAAEVHWIATMRSRGQADLNITDGGESRAGSRWTDAQRLAKSESMRGERNPMFGRTITPEQMSRRVEKIRGTKMSAERREGMSASRRGVDNNAATLTEEQVRAIHRAAFTETFASIANRFNTTASTVGRIANYKSWTHLKLGAVPKKSEQFRRAAIGNGVRGTKRSIGWYHKKFHSRGQSVLTMANCPDCRPLK